MKKREADFGVLFRHWVRAYAAEKLPNNCDFELKQTQTDSFPFASVEDHQAVYHQAVEKSPLGVLTRIQGTNGECDYVYQRFTPVFIVIKYPGFFVLIPRSVFMREYHLSKRKSLTSERAREISSIIVDL